MTSPITDKPTTAPKVVTRFAPSPTGMLHIGGARTALFNWLYARHTNGTFRLRIEDTDRARSTQPAISAILDGLGWLGLDWDGQTTYQFAQAHRHQEIAQALLEKGLAYRCWLTPAELEAKRAVLTAELKELRLRAAAEKRPVAELAAAQGFSMRIESPWRDRDPRDAPPGVAPSLRLALPRSGETVIEDRVQGSVQFKNQDLEDLVLLRSDGTPTYNLAVVVDDHDMGVTHVIRGDDHLSNSPKQARIYDAMGWDRPVFAHVPLIHNAQGKKLSKREGAAGIEDFRGLGYLPEAMRNYLVRLGWSHGDDEIIATAQLIEWFDLDAIGQSPARLDFQKLDQLNGHYIRQTSNEALLERLRKTYPDLRAAKPTLPEIASDADWARLAGAIPSLRERAKTLADLAAGAAYLFVQRPLTLDAAAAKAIDPAARALLRDLGALLKDMPHWEASALEGALRTYGEVKGVKLGKLAQPLRAALTGSGVSPPIFDVMVGLGREETIARIADLAAPAGGNDTGPA